MDDAKGFLQVLNYLNERIKKALQSIPDKGKVQEIRMRSARPLTVNIEGAEYFVTENGGLSRLEHAGLKIVRSDIEMTFKAVCEYSLHSFQKEISQGYITLAGGHRVGLCGTAVHKDERLDTIKYLSGLNFRIAHQVLGSADEVMKRCYHGRPPSLLIAGAPSSGKTTILRDLCRQLGNKHNLSVVDERSEIAAMYQGQAQNDIGVFTDVLDGYSKEIGILTAIRVLSPEIVVVDEIGNLSDCSAIEHSMHAGVKMIATVHAGSFQEVYARRHIKNLLEQGVFQKLLLLGTGNQLGQIVECAEVKNNAESMGNSIDHRDNFCGGQYVFTKADR